MCPKDSFPLPRIDLIVDATVDHELLSFMDAFSGYNQISMDPEDQEKTSFVTGQGTYCYRVMPFRLKNAGATYQRLVNRMFQKKIGASMEVYIDDMLVKSTTEKLAMASQEDLSRLTPIEHLAKPSIDLYDEEVSPVMSEPSWMDPIWDYLIEGLLPNDPKEASKLRTRSSRFTIHRGSLYKRGFFTPILK